SFDVIRMHHCLRIQEIVGLWCSHLEESSTISLEAYSTIAGESWKRPALKDLAVVARTCRAFHGPALDALWRSTALVNLLRCMPSDLSWNVTCDMDWDRVLIYAPRVHHLFSNSYDCDLSKVLPVSACLPPRLFPHLQRLHWGHSDNDFRYIHLFLGPGITELSFTTVAIRSNLSAVSVAEIKAVSVFLRSLTCVETISVDTYLPVANRHSLRLGILPTLSAFNAGPDIRALAVLRRLYLARAEIGVTTRFLGWCKEMPLKSLVLEFITFLTGQETPRTSSMLFPPVSTWSTGTRIGTCAFPHPLCIAHSIPTLVQFHQPHVGTHRNRRRIDLDNATVSTLARAWPRLEHLEISSFYQYSPARATSCYARSGSSRVVHSALVYLHVEHSPISTPLSVARFLSGIFTVLKEIRSSTDDNDSDLKMNSRSRAKPFAINLWKEVESLLPELLAIREEERILAPNNPSL
ncbi:hypothetical protein C8J57DRAFT_1407356, partial [Mycena rebaudengoi]